MANWGDYFSDAFTKSFTSTQSNNLEKAKFEFEKWKTEKEMPYKTMQIQGQILDTVKTKMEMGIPLSEQERGFVSSFGQAPMGTGQMPMQGGAVPPNIPMGANPPQMGGVPFVPKGLNAFGVPTGYEPDPIATGLVKSKMEEKQKSTTALSGQGRFLEQFERSYGELKKDYPDIGAKGFGGWATRKKAGIETAFDKYPETKAFLAELKPLANEQARVIEGGRVTDEDRKIYADALASVVENPSQTNIRLSSNALKKLYDKGGDISPVLYQLNSSKTDIMQNIYNETIKGIFPDFDPKKQKLQFNKQTKEYRIVNK